MQLIDEYSKNLNAQDLGIFWQLTIKTIEDLRFVANENLLLEMYIMQLMHVKGIASTEELSNNISSKEALETSKKKSITENTIKQKEQLKPTSFKKQLKSTEQAKSNPTSRAELSSKHTSKFEINTFEDLINTANRNKEVELKYDLERNVKLVNFAKGKINITFNEKLNQNFIKILTEKLLKWTGERWIISLTKEEGAKTYFEKIKFEKENKLSKERNNELSKKIQTVFPDAKLVNVEEEDIND